MDAVLPLAVAVPLLSAAIVAGLGHLVPRRVADAFTILATGTTAALCLVVFRRAGTHDVVHWFGGWRPQGGVALGVDLAAGPLNAGLAALAAVLVLAAAVFAWRYFETVRTLSHVLMLVFCAAMVGFALSGDLFNMFVFFELMSVA